MLPDKRRLQAHPIAGSDATRVVGSNPQPLQLAEATELCYALVQHLAARQGIRVLMIKGPSLERHGLRAHRTSSDVDVLVEPTRNIGLALSLRRSGWVERESTIWNAQIATHAKSYWHPAWPCDIDVHTRFPGFMAPALTVFDELWARRITMRFAHVPCFVPDRPSSALMLALHSLRGSARQPRHAAELTHLIERVRQDPGDVAALMYLAESTACISSVGQFLEAVGVDLTDLTDTASDKSKRDWVAHVSGAESGMYLWLNGIRNARGWARVSLGFRSLWPSRRDLAVSGATDASWIGRLRLRMRRLARGITAAIVGTRDVIRQHRGRRTSR